MIRVALTDSDDLLDDVDTIAVSHSGALQLGRNIPGIGVFVVYVFAPGEWREASVLKNG